MWKQRTLLIWILIPSWVSLSSKLTHLPKAPPPNAILSGVRASMYELGSRERHNSLQPGSPAILRLIGERVKKKHIVCMSDGIGQKRNLLH